MCGINGFIKTANTADSLAVMNTALKHRGPDFSGTYTDSDVCLGHTLLSIRGDLEKSEQPVSKTGSPWVLLFNGQLYNTKHLQRFLGHEYSTEELDTTLLYGAILHEGINFAEHIAGMYAIVLYNKETKEISLLRDHSGQKNIYYYHKDGDFIFSSEIKGILIHKHISREVDEEGVALATTIGYIPGSKTLFKYIKKLEPGNFLTYSLTTKEITLQRASYFKESFSENTKEALQELVALHLQSKERVALNLSGGLDSSILLHEMSAAGHTLSTYTTRFVGGHEKYNRDADLAQLLAKEYGAQHHEIEVTKELFLENLQEAYATIEEPNYNITNPAYLITAKTEGRNGDNNRVILSGDGGDEIFGGYPYYLTSKKMSLQSLFLTPWLFNILKNKRNGTALDFSDPVMRWYFFKKMSFNASTKSPSESVLLPYLKTLFNSQTNGSVEYSAQKDPVFQLMLADRIFWLPNENFIRSDKLYMSQSIELRSPFAYQPFRDFIDKKNKPQSLISAKNNKLFIRKLYDGKLPDYITKRSDKTGWRSPLHDWYDKSYKDLFLEIISQVEKNQGLIDWKRIKTLIENTDQWPKKYIHLYLSLAILSTNLNIEL